MPLAEHPFTGLVGLPGERVLRADRTLRHTGRPPLSHRRLPLRRHRRDHGLGAGAFSQGRFRPPAVRRHRALRARGSSPGRAPRVGHADLQLRPPRGAQLPRRQRALLAATSSTWTGSGWMPSPRCCTSTTAGRRGSGCPTSTAGARTSRRWSSSSQLNATVAEEQPGCFTVAEESTSWPRVTGPVSEGGLGFTFKWNMGWMHDTLDYFSKDPVHRRYHHERLTFGMMYEYSEHFIMPLSHDEVVHGKGTLLGKMPGDEWQKFANLRTLFAYQYTRPGKPLLFMGSELGSYREWNHDSSLDWHLESRPLNGGLHALPRRPRRGVPRALRAVAGRPGPRGVPLARRRRPRSVRLCLPAPRRRPGDAGAAQPHAGAAPGLSSGRAACPAGTPWCFRATTRSTAAAGSAWMGELETEPVEWQHQPRLPSRLPAAARRRAARAPTAVTLDRGAVPLADGSTRFSVWAPKARHGRGCGRARRDGAHLPAGPRVRRRAQRHPAGRSRGQRLQLSSRRRARPTRSGEPLASARRPRPDAESWTPAPSAGPMPAGGGSRPPTSSSTSFTSGPSARAGTFDGVIERLPALRELGVTAIEIMPVAEFPGSRNWGYDGVSPYAVQSTYGGPDGLKRLVDAAHRLGLAVLLDVVYNHLGPEGNYLREFGPYFSDRYRTAWGEGLNLDGPDSDEVRRYVVDNAVYWVTEYHLDGLRLDAVDRIVDLSPVHIAEELGAAVHAQGEALGSRKLVIAEIDANDPKWVTPARGGRLRTGRALVGRLPPCRPRRAHRRAGGLLRRLHRARRRRQSARASATSTTAATRPTDGGDTGGPRRKCPPTGSWSRSRITIRPATAPAASGSPTLRLGRGASAGRGSAAALALRAAPLHGRGARRDQSLPLFREPRRSGAGRGGAEGPAGGVRHVRVGGKDSRSAGGGDLRGLAAGLGARDLRRWGPDAGTVPRAAAPPADRARPAPRGCRAVEVRNDDAAGWVAVRYDKEKSVLEAVFNLSSEPRAVPLAGSESWRLALSTDAPEYGGHGGAGLAGR